MKNKIARIALVIAIATVLAGCGTDTQPTTAPVNGVYKAEQEIEKNIDFIKRSKAARKEKTAEAETPVKEEIENKVSANTESKAEDSTQNVEEAEIEVKGIEAITMYAVSKANVRELPGTDKAIIGNLEKGQEVVVNGVSGNWYKVAVTESMDGYVHNSLLQAEKPTESAVDTTAAEGETNELCVGFAKEVFDATNAERVAAGLPELIWSDELAIAADIRAEEIIDDAHFSHVRPDGTKCYVLSDKIHGENIAKGPHASGAEFVQHWMESEGHKWNILCDKYTMMGVGTRCTERGDTGVQIFGY